MKSIQSLLAPLGVCGIILWYVLGAMLVVAPLVILNLPWWANLAILFGWFNLPFGNFTLLLLYIWAMFNLGDAPDKAVIFFWICFAINVVSFWGMFLVGLIVAFFTKD